MVVPALGIGASDAFLAGLYEEAEGDVPRIAAIPNWIGVGVFDGERWLDSSTAAAVRGYSQVLDMRSGTIRTSYDWSQDDRTTRVVVESFVSRADPHLAVIRVRPHTRTGGARCGPDSRSSGRPPPRRLALARLEKSDPAWKPADIWYPGHMRVRSREASVKGAGGSLAVTSTPEGRKTTLAQAAEVWWDAELPRAAPRARTASDSAWIEVAFDAKPGATYRFVQVVSAIASTDGQFPLTRAVQEAALARGRGYDSLAADNARRLGTPVGDGHRDRGRPRASARGPLDAVLSARERRPRHRHGHSAHGTLERRVLRPRLLGLRYLDVSSPAR